MADIPLRLTSWRYVPETNRVVAQFVDVPVANHPDPASHVSTMNFYIEFIPGGVEQDGVPGGP